MMEAHVAVAHASSRDADMEVGYACTADARASAAASMYVFVGSTGRLLEDYHYQILSIRVEARSAAAGRSSDLARRAPPQTECSRALAINRRHREVGLRVFHPRASTLLVASG
jgi:hypothetical protein